MPQGIFDEDYGPYCMTSGDAFSLEDADSDYAFSPSREVGCVLQLSACMRLGPSMHAASRAHWRFTPGTPAQPPQRRIRIRAQLYAALPPHL